MTTPLDELTQHVRPGGPAETPCPGIEIVPGDWSGCVALDSSGQPSPMDCPTCEGSHVIVSPQAAAVREALWEECIDVKQREIFTSGNAMKAKPCIGEGCDVCESGRGYAPRSRAEAALLLPDALAKIHTMPYGGISIELCHYKYVSREFWTCELKQREGGRFSWRADGEGNNWLDALSAVALAVLKAEEKP